MLIDAHVHIFPNVNGYGPKGHTHGEGYGRIDAGDGIAQDVLPAINEKTSHTLQMLLHEMRQGQVDKAVLILCPCYGDWSEYVLQACRDYPEQFTASAFFDPWRPAARQYYTEKLEGPLWKNIKIEFSEAGGLYGVYPGVQLDAPELRWLWEAMEAGGKTVSFDLGRPGDGSYQTDQIAAIAKRHPGLKLVLCHMGQPSRTAERDPKLWSAWLEQIRLGTLPNVWFDLSALPYHVQKEEEYPFPSTKRYFDLARGIVGAKKLLWGTDIPWLLGTANYQQLVAHGKFLLSDCTEKEREMIFAENAWDVYWNHRK